MIREAHLHIPTRAQDGSDLHLVHIALGRALYDTFGGFTATRCDGCWRDYAGQRTVEAVTRYTIAADWSEPLQGQLRDLAFHFGRMADQDCVYLVDHLGEVHFLKLGA